MTAQKQENTQHFNRVSSLSVDKSRLLSLSPDSKEKYVDELTITYPKVQQIINIIKECKNSKLTSQQPECASILGPSRTGKSTIAKEFKKIYPDFEQEDGVIKPVLLTKVPCPAHIGSLIVQLLNDIGDPFYIKRETTGKSTHRLYQLLRKCQVELIILDEVQHLVDRDSRKLIRESADWFKNLIDDTGISVVFMGLPESEKIFYENEQLGGRVLNREKIYPFKYEEHKLFRAFLYTIDSYLPFKYDSGLARPDLWQRLFIATEGYIGFIKPLLKRATKIAAINKLDSITIPVLAQAFNDKLAFQGNNPFLPGFDIEKAIEMITNKGNDH